MVSYFMYMQWRRKHIEGGGARLIKKNLDTQKDEFGSYKCIAVCPFYKE